MSTYEDDWPLRVRQKEQPPPKRQPREAGWHVWTDASIGDGLATGAWAIYYDGRCREMHVQDLLHSGDREALEKVTTAELVTLAIAAQRVFRLSGGGVAVMFHSDSQHAVARATEPEANFARRPEGAEKRFARRLRRTLAESLPGSRVLWISRDRNRAADALARRGLNGLRRELRVLRYEEDGTVSESRIAPEATRVYAEQGPGAAPSRWRRK